MYHFKGYQRFALALALLFAALLELFELELLLCLLNRLVDMLVAYTSLFGLAEGNQLVSVGERKWN